MSFAAKSVSGTHTYSHGNDDAVRKLVEEMVETMNACDGIGLAAPQVHHSIKLFIIETVA